MEASKETCSIGYHLKDPCHKLTFIKLKGLKEIDTLDDISKETLILRTNFVENITGHNICLHHEQKLLNKFHLGQKKCCNPLEKDSHKGKGSLREVTLEMAKKLKERKISIVPGKKICPSCRKDINETLINEHEEALPHSDEEVLDFEANLDGDRNREILNSSLIEEDISPLKLHAVASHSRVAHGKRKIAQVQSRFRQKQLDLQITMAKAIDVEPRELDLSSEEEKTLTETEQKAKDFDVLLFLMKEKIRASSRKEIIKILTLTPKSWSIRKTADFFNVSNYLVRSAFKLRKEKGILSEPQTKRGKCLPNEIIQLVEDFYCDDEFSRQMPGKKDYVSISRGVHRQKRLIMMNLNELYAVFKTKFPEVKIGFSKFCMLRPKWCVTVGSSGAHSVCVCSIHQNVKLLLKAVDLEQSYHELIEMIVCNRNNRECMIHRCVNCPGTRCLKDYLIRTLKGEFEEDSYNSDTMMCEAETDKDSEQVAGLQRDDFSEEAQIIFNQWCSTDRTEMIKQTATVDDFIDLLVEKLDNITKHSFIAKKQAEYLKERKTNLKEDEVIAILDFAENYQFIVQDEVQGFHWNKSQCTLHPIVLYTKENLDLVSESLCFISDDLDHDVGLVYFIIQETVKYIKAQKTNFNRIEYFSDGCAAQYKNCKNFVNICHHYSDFGSTCCWSFFATSHGKSACDGLGGTVKRIATRASLQRAYDNQILTANQLFHFCQSEVNGIKFLFVEKENSDVVRQELKPRFEMAKTVPGTRSYHHIFPLSKTCIGTKLTSSDKEFSSKFDFLINFGFRKVSTSINSFVICKYDLQYWVGFIEETNKSDSEVKVRFLHPKCPARSYFWPEREDTCRLPDEQVIQNLQVLSTSTGRQYKLSNDDEKILSKLLKNI